MKKQAIEQTLLNEIKEYISQFATNKTVKERIINFEPSKNLDEVICFQKETVEGVNLLENKVFRLWLEKKSINYLKK